MNALQSTHTNHVRVMWLAVALALMSTLAYVLIALDLLGIGDLQMGSDGDAIIYVAAGSLQKFPNCCWK